MNNVEDVSLNVIFNKKQGRTQLANVSKANIRHITWASDRIFKNLANPFESSVEPIIGQRGVFSKTLGPTPLDPKTLNLG